MEHARGARASALASGRSIRRETTRSPSASGRPGSRAAETATLRRYEPIGQRVRGASAIRGAGRYRLRILRVLARTEFKLKYAGSVLGYFWSLAKPLLYFAVLWIVFGHLFHSTIPNFPLYLLIGIVLYTFGSLMQRSFSHG